MRLLGYIFIIVGFIFYFHGPYSQIHSLSAIIMTLIGQLALQRADINSLENRLDNLDEGDTKNGVRPRQS